MKNFKYGGYPQMIHEACKDCIYYGAHYQANEGCNYILMVGHSRGCDPGPGCTKKVLKTAAKRRKKETIRKKA